MSSIGLVLLNIFICSSLCCFALIFLAKKGWFSYQTAFQSKADTKLSELFLFIDPQKLFTINVIAILLIPITLYWVFDSYIYAAFAFIALIVMPRFMYHLLFHRRIKRFEQDLPDALAQMAGSIRAGATLPNAIEMLSNETKGPISQEFSFMLKQYRLGVPIDSAMTAMNKRVPCDSLNLMVAAANVAKEVGGNLAEIFERLADTLRQKMVMEGKIIALTSQGKLQGWVVGMLPIGMIAILYQMEPDAMSHLGSSIFGWGFIGFIVILECLGLFMIRKIVTIDV